MEFKNEDGIVIVENIIKVIQTNRDYLSEIDGAIGDGDHGINMSKGFTMAYDAISKEKINMSNGFRIIGMTLMDKIGGSMGPLYGNFFRGLYTASKEYDTIDGEVILAMIQKGYENITSISPAKVGDKTLIDVLFPAMDAYKKEWESSKDIVKSLEALMNASKDGVKQTKDLVAKLGRASRLKERSLGFQDAGATSCDLILETMSQSIIDLVK